MWKEQLLRPVTSTKSNVPTKPKRKKDECKEKFLKMIGEIENLGIKAGTSFDLDDDDPEIQGPYTGSNVSINGGMPSELYMDMWYTNNLEDKEYCDIMNYMYEVTYEFYDGILSEIVIRDWNRENDKNLFVADITPYPEYEHPDWPQSEGIANAHTYLKKFEEILERYGAVGFVYKNLDVE